MKARQDPIFLLNEITKKCAVDRDGIINYASNRRNRLHRAFYTNFNPEQFISSMESTTADLISGKSDDIPLIGGIPITDLLVFGDKRLDEMSKLTNSNAKIKSQELISQVIQIGDICCMPISIATADLGNNHVHIPTFGEVFYDSLSKGIIRSAHDDRKKGLQAISAFETFVAKLDEVNVLLGTKSVPLAIIGLQLAYGHKKSITAFEDSVLATACLHLIETQVPYLNDDVIENLLNSAHQLSIDLKELKISNKVPLGDFFQASQKDDLFDKFESLCVLNETMNVVNQNYDRINHDYDPNAYFDM